MKKSTLLLLFIALAILSQAQTSKITGSWLATKVEVDGEVEEPYFVMEFKENGKMEIMGMELASWEYDKGSKSIIMLSDFDKDFNGESKIIKLTKNDMVISKDGATIYYTKVDPNKIAANNKKSQFVGTWSIENTNDAETSMTLKFELPDTYVMVEKEYGSTTTTNGTWAYNPDEETIIITGFSELLLGKNIITSLSDESFELDNKGNIITAVKEETASNEIERLDFTENDFYTEDGDYKYYDDEQKLPWQDTYKLISSLEDVSQLVYKYSTLIQDTDAFNSKTLTADVHANEEEQTLSIDYIFYGYDNYNLPEDTQLPPNNEYTNALFPLNGDAFRVVGIEQITTPAGTFDCTVIEALGDFEVLEKLWMINDRPGIYAKIIQEKVDVFRDLEYKVFELQEIR